jgi:hypothetical protein
VDFLAKLFGPTTVGRVFVCSLQNVQKTDERTPSIVTRNPIHISGFARKYDVPGRGVFFCVATLRGERRVKDGLCEITCAHCEIDNTDESVLARLALRPSAIVHSGRGFHLYWAFKEALPASPETISAHEDLLRRLILHLGGDPGTCDATRLLRLPGTHNTKEGGWRPVRVILDELERRFDPEELRDWLSDVVDAPPLFSPGEKCCAQVLGDSPKIAPGTPAVQTATADRIEIRQALAAMSFSGSPGIHDTQLRCSAAMLARGFSVEETVERILRATRRAAGEHAARWNWRAEEHAIRTMCATWLAKHPELNFIYGVNR